MKIKECCTVESQECIAKGIYSMWISTKVIAKEAKAGQFISLFSKDGSRLLPRPISLCEIDREGGRLRIVYRVAGAGTEEFSHLKAGDEVDILGPLGNGFPIEEGKGKRVMLMGGGRKCISDRRRYRCSADAADGEGSWNGHDHLLWLPR